MKIEHINFPHVFTDTGQRYNISQIKGTPRVGAMLDDDLKVINGVAEACAV